jgi:hypothetical protein
VEQVKLALIPPFAYLDDTSRTHYQLMLPHLVSHPEYEKTYRDLCADPNQFVILDNGVAEGKQIDFKEILDIADNFGVNEVVLPDVMGDAVATMNAASRAIYVHGMHYPVHYMYVLQGQTIEEVLLSARFAASFGSVKTLGIPRHLIETLGDERARWRIADRIFRDLNRQMATRSIHLLGMHPTVPREMEYGPRWLKHMIRGFDTSAPYNFAYYASSMSGPERVQCKRPQKYFEQDAEEFQPMMVYKNIEYLEGCAR